MKKKYENKILRDNPKFHSIKWLKKIHDKKFNLILIKIKFYLLYNLILYHYFDDTRV